MKVLNDNVLVDKINDESRGGIVLPNEVKSERFDFQKVRIVGVGPDVNPGIAVGDLCLMSPMKGQECNIGGRDLFLCKEEEIEAKIVE